MSNVTTGDVIPMAAADLTNGAAPDAESSTTLPADRKFVINRPGNINVAFERGSYPGCKLVAFTHEDEINAFFTEHANLLVVQMWIDSKGTIFVLYTNTLEGEELEEFNEFSRTMSQHMQEWREKRAERRVKETEAREKAEAEVKRLVTLGRTCEEHHANVIEENRKLKKAARKEA